MKRISTLAPRRTVQYAVEEYRFDRQHIQRMNRIKKESGIPSGFPSLDKITGGGWRDPGLILVASRPNAGKSTFARDIAWHAAIDYGLMVRSTPVGFFSLEHSQDKIRRYFTLSHSGISSKEDMFGEFEQAQTIMIAHVMDAAGLSIDDTPCLPITGICSKAKRLVKSGRAKMIVIDSLHLIRGPKELCGSREDELKYILEELQTTAKELGIPIIVLFQMSKNAYLEQFDLDKSLGHINKYMPYADMVIFLHRPFIDFPDNVIANGEDPNKVRVIVAENSFGGVGETSLLLNTDRASFSPMSGLYPYTYLSIAQPIKLGILSAMAQYEENHDTKGHTYKACRITRECAATYGLRETIFVQELYSMARSGIFVKSQGNVGTNYENYASPEYVEVALTDIGKALVCTGKHKHTHAFSAFPINIDKGSLADMQ